MKTQTQDEPQHVHYVVTNGQRKYDDGNCPPGIRATVEKAIKRGQERSGRVAGAGSLWHWQCFDTPQDSIHLQLVGAEEEYFGSIEIPRSKWEKFSKSAKLRGMSATDFLISILAEFVRINSDVGYEEAAALLFGEHHEEKVYYVGRSPEVARFESASTRFHGAEVLS